MPYLSLNHSTTSKAWVSLLALSLGLIAPLSCYAADFGQAQHVYVPPSLLERRADFTETREQQAMQQYKVDHPSSQRKLINVDSAGGFGAGKHTYGASSAPSAVTHVTGSGVVPPPPPYSASLSGAAKELSGRLHKAATSPAVQAALKDLKQQAEDYARSGKLTEAKHAVAEALQLTPHDKALLKDLGNISVQRAKQLMQTTDLESATKFARQALSFDPANPEAKKVLDGLLQREGINPLDPVQRLKSADLLASHGRNDEAYVEYQASDKLKPSADARVGMGNMALRAGQKDLARSDYLSAAQTNPGSGAAHRQLGMLKLKQSDIVGANTELSRALILDPKDKDAAKALVELWQNQVSRVPGANSHLGLARAYQLAGDLQSAQAEYRTVVSIDPDNPHLAAARQSFKLALSRQDADRAAEAAATLESQGALPAAYEKLVEATQLNPGDAQLHLKQGFLAEKLNRVQDARQAYMDALKINPHNVVAAARIKELSTAPLAFSPAPPVFVPTQPAMSAAESVAAAAARSHDAGLDNISNFAYALRNHMMLQKNTIAEAQDQAHRAVESIGKHPPAESLVSAPSGLIAQVPKEDLAALREPLPVPGAVSEMPPMAPPITPSPAAPYTSMFDPIPSNDVAPPLAPPIALPGNGGYHTSSIPPGNVKFELLKAAPKDKEVLLHVVLRNEAETPLLIPRNTHGVIRYVNRQDAVVKVTFDSTAVSPHGLAHGIIHVPYQQADPTADLVLPEFLPANALGDRDVHLTANLASRPVPTP